MNINDLPDDCLLTIFEYFDLLEDFLNLSKVCSKWAQLTSQRLSKVKWLLFEDRKSNLPGKVIYMKDPKILKNLILNELLPNLEILDITHDDDNILTYEEFEKLISDNPKIKGVINPLNCPEEYEGQCLSNIQMIVVDEMVPQFKGIFHSNNLTQLVVFCYITDFGQYTEYFKNLVRLHVYEYKYDQDTHTLLYNGPDLTNLKILELSTHYYDLTGFFPGYRLMDYCTSLESAFFSTDTYNFSIDKSTKNYNLRDLVIEHTGCNSEYLSNIVLTTESMDRYPEWPSLRSLLSKFPKLKHLAIRGNDDINDDNIKELKDLLPEIELMDFRGSSLVTQESANYFERHSERSKRSIKIYYDCSGDEPSDWPKLEDNSNDSICLGFDFMKHCFFKYWHQLPELMVPE